MFVCGELLLGAAVYVNEVSGLKIHSTANVRDRKSFNCQR